MDTPGSAVRRRKGARTPKDASRKTPLHTPKSVSLTPNDDETERAEVRKNRSMQKTSKSLAGELAQADGQPTAAQGLSGQQLLMMYDRIIKLTAENKINKDNAWSLDFISKLPDIIRNESQANEFSFQKASCGLDASVRIYSKRVDSTYEIAFSTLQHVPVGKGGDSDDEDGGNGGQGAEGEENGNGGEGADGQQQRKKKKAQHADVDPSATLADAESLKMKSFELTFDTDPLFSKTSKLFDENSAAGLLMVNMGVFDGCRIMFDSNDVPMDKFSCSAAQQQQQQQQQRLDLSSIAGLGQAVSAATGQQRDMTPSIHQLEAALGMPPPAWATSASADDVLADALAGVARNAAAQAEAVNHQQQQQQRSSNSTLGGGDDSAAADASEYYDALGGGGDNDDEVGGGGDFGGDEFGDDSGAAWSGGQDAEEESGLQGPLLPGGDDGLVPADEAANISSVLAGDALTWLAGAGLGQVSKGTGWAGASFWRYRAAPGAASAAAGASAADKPAKASRRKKEDFAIDFESDDFAIDQAKLAPGTAKQLNLASQPAVNTLLPEDVHYQAADLFKLFTRPGSDVYSLWRRRAAVSAAAAAAAAAEGGGANAGFDHGAVDTDDSDYGSGDIGYDDFVEAYAAGQQGGGEGIDVDGVVDQGLLAVPRRVQKIEVNYARTAKQIDVKALKELLWRNMETEAEQGGKDADLASDKGAAAGAMSFQRLINDIPELSAAGRQEDISIHLCFICLLHLANEHGLAISNKGRLDTLMVEQFPSRA